MPDTASKPATSSNNPSSTPHLDYLKFVVINHDDFDLEYHKANMEPDEYNRYVKSALKRHLRFLIDLVKG